MLFKVESKNEEYGAISEGKSGIIKPNSHPPSQTKKCYNIAKLRYSFLIVVILITVFIMSSQYDFISKGKNDLEQLALEVQKTDMNEVQKSDMNIETKEKIESSINDKTNANINSDTGTTNTDLLDDTMKTILIWTLPNQDPLMFLLRDNEAFVTRKCKVTNCYITTNKDYLDITEFDVVLFNGPEVVDKKNPKLPPRRSPRQNYVFASVESSDYYPICDNRFDGYFNISWTYKLNSDIFYGYVVVRNSEGDIVGPQKEMHWLSIDEMKPVNDTIKQKLSTKKKLAAWLVSNCYAPSGRDQFVKKVQAELKKLGTDMQVDVYGDCGTIPCARHKMHHCLQMFEQDYYFYFSFENSFTEDYVTEKLLHPLQHYAVPVVYGTANYTRFLPEGIYLNALELGPKELAKQMIEIVADKEQYYNYFKWMNHYSFHYVEEVPETDFYCKFCEAMNDPNLMSRTTVIEKFKKWWNPPKIRKGACPARL